MSSPTPFQYEETRFSEMVFPDQANHYGALFAGSGLALLSKAALIAASRRARRDVVMARSEATDFLTPVQVGELLDMVARVVRVGRTSLTVEVEGVAEILSTGVRRPALHGRFEMVAVDADGRPTPLSRHPEPFAPA
ncbi:MAG: hotdog domain-containing protein [Candidatus Brevundimonas colombiensis]|uniref:Hotdog domain-containing protein n=1 Tax=Candidatus Brevundimonas colombiensis TaxID=3121376 RepID=A0AAJ5X0A1_9CAUL|nr:hotdog domain-containing protein [Brevundimonas sp.]WEK39807.1 MAG: hotdog domain-containing protein [Brevundimonas sp.]